MVTEDASDLALQAARFLEEQKQDLSLPDLRIVTQEEFLSEAELQPGLSEAERLTLVNQAELVLRSLYAHLAFKKTENPDANPFVALQQIREQLATLSDFDFHTCMLLALAKVRDVHTSYTAPPPYQGAVAFLPFQLRFYEEPKGQFHFLVAKTMATSPKGGLGHEDFRVGAEVVAWNGLDPAEATRVAAEMQPGANLDAELSRGTARMTIRSIASHSVTAKGGVPPFEVLNHATIRYVSPGEKKKREITFPWQVATGFGAGSFTSAAFSVSDAMTMMQRWSKCSYRPDKLAARGPGDDDWFEAQFATEAPRAGCPDPELLRNAEEPEWPFGYLRIRNFAGDTPPLLEDAKLAEVTEMLRRLDREARGGLILDIRGNPGGQIRLAERMLQLLSPREIKPLLFHYPRTELVREVIEFFRTNSEGAGRFEEWLDHRPGDENADEHLTPGRTITPPSLANDTGQAYQGPVVLLFDALTYSAADMFAAGFQDHELGELIGVDCSTGGGGADKWSYQDIVDSLKPVPGIELADLPTDCRLTVAVRRCTRTGADPLPIEDNGVAPNHFRARTERDVLEGNRDLYAFACERLVAPVARIDVEEEKRTANGLEVTISSIGVEFVVFRVGAEVLASGAVKQCEPRTFTLAIPDGGAGPVQIRMEGYEGPAEAADGRPPLVAPRLTLRGEENRSTLSFLRTPPSARRRREASSA